MTSLKYILLIFCYLSLARPLLSAIAFDASGSACGSGTTIDITGATHGLTIGSGSNRLLIVGIAQGNTEEVVSSVTWDQGGSNQSMTKIANHGWGSGDVRVEMWKLTAPTSGNKTLRIVLSVSAGVAVGLVAYTGIDQTTPNDTQATADGSGNPSVNVSSATNDLVIDAVAQKETAENATAGAGQTERVEISCASSDEDIYMSEEAGTTTVTMSWTAGTEEWATIGVSLNPAADPPAGGGGGRGQVIIIKNDES